VVAAFDLNTESLSFKFKRKNSFDLLEDTVVAPTSGNVPLLIKRN
jgi:hypothetical protein